VNRPETSSSPWHDVSTNVAYGQPQGCSARGLAASPAMGEGTTRDHFRAFRRGDAALPQACSFLETCPALPLGNMAHAIATASACASYS
jgi:hypothetical protein